MFSEKGGGRFGVRGLSFHHVMSGYPVCTSPSCFFFFLSQLLLFYHYDINDVLTILLQ